MKNKTSKKTSDKKISRKTIFSSDRCGSGLCCGQRCHAAADPFAVQRARAAGHHRQNAEFRHLRSPAVCAAASVTGGHCRDPRQ